MKKEKNYVLLILCKCINCNDNEMLGIAIRVHVCYRYEII